MLVIPYKYCGLDISEVPPTLMSNGANNFLLVPSQHYYRVYKLPQLKIVLDSVVFEHKISAIAQGANDEHVFVGMQQIIYVMKYHNCIDQIELPAQDGQITSLLVLYPYVLASIGATLYICYQGHIATNFLSESIVGIIHPPTYLNKVVIWTARELFIINFVTNQIIVSIHIEELFAKLNHPYDDHFLIRIEPSPALDVVAVSIGHETDSIVILLNLLSFTVIQRYDTGAPVQAISFNSQGKIPIMALVIGAQIKFIELNKQVLLYTHTSQHAISWTKFVSSDNSIYVGSAAENSIKCYDFDYMEQFTCIRERSGFEGHISRIEFLRDNEDPYGSLNLIGVSDLETAELRWLSLINENMNTRFTMKSNKALSKAKKLTEEQVGNTLPAVEQFSFSANRASDWSNVLTTHKYHCKPSLWNTSNRSINKIKVDFDHSLVEKSNRSMLTAVYVTNCGNFGLLALDDNRLIKITMQSGSHVKTIPLPAKVSQIFSDPLNQFIVIALVSGQILQLDFFSGSTLKEIVLDSKVTHLSQSHTSVLILTIMSNCSILIWDYTQLKVIRKLIGHQHTVTAAQLTHENQHVISSSEAPDICIWSVLTGQLLQRLNLRTPIITLDISPNGIEKTINNPGNYLCTTIQQSRTIAVYTIKLSNSYEVARATKEADLVFASDFRVNPQDPRSQVFRKVQKMEEELPIPTLDYQESTDTLITFTILEDGKWVPLQHIDQIRERNRVKLAEEDVKIPFFMDFRNIDAEKQKLLDELKEKGQAQSKIIKHKKDQHMAELASNFEKLLAQQDFVAMFALLKTLSPSHVDYEMRSGLLGKPQNVLTMVSFFDFLFEGPGELDLKVTYFNHFLKISTDDINLIYDNEIHQRLLAIQQKLIQSWAQVEQLKDFVDGVTEYLKQRK